MRRALLLSIAFLLVAACAAAADAEYFPAPGDWERRSPAEAGFDPVRLQAAVDFAVRHETDKPRDLALEIAETRAREPHNEIIGPTRPRGGPTGVILRGGYLVAQWGDPARVDMTFSVTKSLLSAVVGIAHDRGLIDDLDAPVRGVIPGDHFESEHNRGITWDQLLRQTSNWRGTLWDKPDWADRPVGNDPAAWPTLPVPPPGQGWKYNDVRVNLLALAAAHVWREPLPAVAARELFGPIGATGSWEWHGYENSWIELDGRRIQSVSGGGHWGGGLFINVYDLARFGLLCQRGGRWGGRRIWSQSWHEYASRPTPQNPGYGVMNWFLNLDAKLLPAAPPSAVTHLGNGTNIVYVDEQNDLVVVARWLERERMAEFIARVVAALGEPAAAPRARVFSGETDDARLAAFFDEIFQRNLKDSPLFQSQLGIKGPDYGKWDDLSDAEAVRQNELARRDLERLRGEFDYDALCESSRVSYRIFEFLRASALGNFPWRFHGYAFSTQNNPATFPVAFMRNIHRVDDASDAEAYISRIAAIGNAARQIIETMDMAAERGIVPTSFSFDPVLEDGRNVLKGAPFDDRGEDSPLLADFRAKVGKLGIAEPEKRRLIDAAVAALRGPYRDGVNALLAGIEGLRGKSPGPHGVWKLPDGDAYYRSQIERWTTEAGLGANEIHDIGLAEVARIRGEMETIMRSVGFKDDLAAFFTFLRRDPGNFFPNTDQGRQAYLDQSKAYIDAVYADVDRYFNILPKAPLEVRRVETWREETAPIAFYNQPTPDGSRPGVYYINLKDMTARQKHEMQTVAYHEGAPGHHFQIAIQQELTGVPMFQKFAFFGAYVEGWGLYAERLGKEQGRFTDPMQDFGRLQNEMLRAARLVVDTGAHAKHWSRERMIDYMLANNPMTPEDAAIEAERYIDNPGQALSYKIGMLKILELRERTKSELGDRFDIRDFHDVMLRNGAVPLPILEDLVSAYIAKKNAARQEP